MNSILYYCSLLLLVLSWIVMLVPERVTRRLVQTPRAAGNVLLGALATNLLGTILLGIAGVV